MIFEMRKIIAGYYPYEAALKEFSLYVNKGEVVSVVGINGSGKSTLLKVAAGLVKQRSGEIYFKGREITALEPRERAKMGMCYIREHESFFSGLTVLENLEIWSCNLGSKELKDRLTKAFKAFPVLRTKKDKKAEGLSIFEQKMLALARVSMTEPELLLVNELTSGLTSIEAASMFSKLKELNQGGLSVLLAEQIKRKTLTIADRCYMIELGNNREVKV